MPKRKPEDREEWSLKKNIILELYMHEDRPLANVISIMASRGFKRTKPQYERTFEKWGTNKNIREEEWLFIFSRLGERERLNKASSVHVPGSFIPDAKLRTQKARLRQKNFDRYLAQTWPTPRADTPPGIEVLTPPSSPIRQVEQDESTKPDALSANARSSKQCAPILPSASVALAVTRRPQNMQQPNFTVFNAVMLDSDQCLDTKAPSPLNVSSTVLWDLGAHKSADRSPSASSSSLLQWFGTAFSVPSFSFNQISDSVADHTSHLANDHLSKERIDPLLRKIILENVNMEKAASLIIRRARNEADLQALEMLFDLGGDLSVALQAFAQRLLVPAVVDGNLPLVQILLDRGVNPNTRTQSNTKSNKEARSANIPYSRTAQGHPQIHNPNISAIQAAVYNRREDMIISLFRHRANNWCVELQGAHGYVSGSILDMIMEMGTREEWTVRGGDEENRSISCNILKTVLRFGPSAAHQSQVRLLRTLRHATLQNRLDLMIILCDYYPMLLEASRETPWTLLEAASTIEGLEIFHFLVSKAFSIHATTSAGLGSVVAAAAKMSNTKLVTQLLNAHADINGVAFGLGSSDDKKQAITNSEKRLEGTHGMAALHIAVRNKDEVLTRLLLYYGANANQDCHVYPLQLAPWSGNEPITRMLIEAGADINAIANKRHCHIFRYPATDRQYILSAWHLLIHQDRYPYLSKLATDMLSIPGSSCECERLFCELGDLLKPRWRNISQQLLAAIQCDRQWIRARIGSGEVYVEEFITDKEMDAKSRMDKWEIG